MTSDLTFSENGWNQYQKACPRAVKVFREGMARISRVPLFGPYFAIFTWAPLAGFVCGIAAVGDLLRRHRFLVKVYDINIKNNCLCGVDISVSSKAFAEEFLRLNSDRTVLEGVRS